MLVLLELVVYFRHFGLRIVGELGYLGLGLLCGFLALLLRFVGAAGQLLLDLCGDLVCIG